MYIRNEDTICAPATVPGTGAISVIRISGSDALRIADKVVCCRKGSICESKGYTSRFGVIYTSDDPDNPECEVLDEVIVSIFRAPHSYTGEDSAEISCHASSYIVASVMERLYKEGARAAEPGEFTKRAFLNGKLDLAQAEAVADVIASQNAAAHRIAFKQMKGGFSSELRSMRSELLELVSLMELELDFSEEEVEFADRSRLDMLLSDVISHISRLIDSFRLGNAIKNGVPVAIAGATNTGKSTLLNALLGEERAIVSDIHGTTRDTIEETFNIDGTLFRFIDTAGLRETSETVEQIGIERTFKKISEASIVLGMIDITRDLESTLETVHEIIEKVDFDTQKLLILLNKIDILEHNKIVNFINSFVLSLNDKRLTTNLSNYHEWHKLEDRNEVYNLIDSTSSGESIGRSRPSDTKAADSEDVIALLPLSAKNGTGITELRKLLASTQRDLLADSDTTLVTNQRHIQALTDARTSLLRVRDGLAAGLPTDLAAQDIREAIYHIGSIVGEISTDEVLGNIFRNFCIGK